MQIPGSLSKKRKERYQQLFALLRKRKNSEDDLRTAAVHEEVFAVTDCLSCANCCKTYPPLLQSKDITRIAAHLGTRESEFVSKYLVIDEDGDWVFHTVPCPFLQADNACSIYAVRPLACREYPHTGRKKLYQIADLTLKNAEICPAVTEILDAIDKKINAL